VTDKGFLWNGNAHLSLSSIARAITGTKWNGPRFFGLRDVKTSRRRGRQRRRARASARIAFRAGARARGAGA
jgi:hypothetical protein